jgi:hypothetical protein
MKVVLTAYLILIAFISTSQNYKLNTRYPGYFVNIKGDTIRGYILLSNKIENQKGGVYSNDAKGEKVVIHLLADQIKSYKVQDRIYTAMMFGEPDPAPEHFILTLAEGELKLYCYFAFSKDLYVGTGSGQRPVTGDDEQYLQKEFLIVNKAGKKFIFNNANEFVKKAEAIFGSNAVLLQKIKDKEKGYRYNDIEKIVKEYNLAVSSH